MNKRFFILLVIFIAAVSSEIVKGQHTTSSSDKFTLLTRPFNQRPLTLFPGQFQANTGYKFAVRSQSYDQDGVLVDLKNNGTGSVYHYYFAELKYGLTYFAELGVQANFLRRGIREATVNLINTTPTTTDNIIVNKLTESKGMGDIFLFTTVRLPIEYKSFDFGLTGGIFLPSAKYEPEKPDNYVATADQASGNYTINLHYNSNNGYGVPVYLFAASAKITYNKFSLMADVSMQDPLAEGHNLRWEESLTERAFSYYDKSYSYLLSRIYLLNVSFHYQATGWFNLFMNTSFSRTKGGWTEYWGLKYKNPENDILNFEPGFELQISPSITIYQTAGFPVKGKNCDAPFYMFTTLSFNMFPFLR